MKRFVALFAALALGLPLALPAEAHIVYFKDGTAVRGTVKVQGATLTVSGADAELSFPLESVRSVSFTDEPIAYEQQRVEESRYFNSPWLIWSAVGVNVLAIATGLVVLSRGGQAQ